MDAMIEEDLEFLKTKEARFQQIELLRLMKQLNSVNL